VIYILIAVGILSVINGTVVTGVKIYEDLITTREIAFSNHFGGIRNKFKGAPMSGVLYGFVLTFIFFVVITIIGVFFIDLGNYTGQFDTKTAGIFSFNDIVSNWDVLFIYVFIGVAILGCLINRKTHKVKVTKSKIFVPAAYIGLALLGLSVLYLLVSVFGNIALVTTYSIQGKYTTSTDQ
jgi:hypothetical protein